jgi:hypothetical protein
MKKGVTMPENPKELVPAFRWPIPWPGPFPGPDPGPDWGSIISHLDKAAFVRVVGVQLDLAKSALEIQQNLLTAQIKAVNAMQDIVKGIR